MSALREEIRAILREELAALRSEMAPARAEVERVRISSSAELNRFVQDVLRRAADPAFSERVLSGDLVFELSRPGPVSAPIVTGPARPAPTVLDKPLITERDIAAQDRSVRSLRLGPHSRLTPLARDEARRRGIRIERMKDD